MPSSRKKAKGKARRAKAKQGNLILHDNNVCRHGCEPMSKDDICYQFVQQFELEMREVHNSECNRPRLLDLHNDIIKRLKETGKYSEIWDSKEYQKKLLQLFVCLGTNTLLGQRHRSKRVGEGHSTHRVALIAITALHSEHNFNTDAVMISKASRSILRDLLEGLLYDASKYFFKRSSCLCLYEIFLQAKTLPRIGLCQTCYSNEKDRKLLFLCGGCWYKTYCSVECQKADWARHQSWCSKLTKLTQSI